MMRPIPSKENYNVIVIGGGPAGSAAAKSIIDIKPYNPLKECQSKAKFPQWLVKLIKKKEEVDLNPGQYGKWM